jgi:hypothetical protein
MAYTDVSKIENLLQRTLTTHEQASLTFVLPAIKQWIDNKTGSTFDETAESTRYYDGGSSSIDLDPCTEITAVKTLNNDNTDSQEYTLYDEYVVEPQNSNVKTEIVRRHGCFTRGLRRVAVTAKFSEYDAGVPFDIQNIATRLAASVIRGSKNDLGSGGLKSESLEGHSVTYATSSDEINSIAEGDPFIKSALSQRAEILVG